MKNGYISLLVTSAMIALFSGCGSDFENSDGRNDNKSSEGSLACAEDYYKQNIEFDLGKCTSCHSAGGQAESTGLVFVDLTEANSHDNFLTLHDYIKDTGTKIIQKNDGTLGHAGGSLFTTKDVNSFTTLINYANGSTACVDSSLAVEDIPLSSVSVVAPAAMARNASLVMLGETPNSTELEAASTDLDAFLDNLLKEDAFYDWLKLRFNDIFLTDRYNRSSDAVNLMDTSEYPQRYWHYGTTEDRNMLGETNTTLRDRKYYRIREKTNYGVARAPLELIAHVVRKELPFGEILTADYMMMNPYSSRTYGVPVDGFSMEDEDDDESGSFSKDDFREIKIPGVPHAGLLTDIMFLNRFPTTATNRNRHRSAKVQLFFLDTDILGLADRPINGTTEDKDSHNPTTNNANCTVCHFVMDPIAGAMQNWDDRGRYRPREEGWYPNMLPPGFSLSERMGSSDYPNSMQWLAKKIVDDPRFARASVKLFYKALTGKDAISKPKFGTTYLPQRQQAYDFQDKVFKDIERKYISSNMNAKVIIKELIKSVFFSGKVADNGLGNDIFTDSIGLSKLISPEILDKKIYDTMGYYWANSYYQDRPDRHYLMRESEYKTLYGGINSNSITKRVSELNGVMANIQMRMAVEMSCYPVSLDFYRQPNERKLFPFVDKNMEPFEDDNITKIKENIVYLHKHILGETVSIDSLDVARTYNLFKETYEAGLRGMRAETLSDSLNGACRVQYDPITKQNLGEKDRRENDLVYYDKAYVIRSWSAVITYMLSDFKFLYQNTAE